MLQRDLFGGRTGEYPIPDDAQLGTCHSCQAPVAWVRTKNDRWTPLSLATVETRDGQRYALTHFSDCPDGKKWSKKR
jgi:hypothetical protein